MTSLTAELKKGLRVSQVLSWAQKALEERGLEASPLLDAQLLLSQAMGLSREELYIGLRDELALDEVHAFLRLLSRRLKGEPIAYITGQKEFMSLTFHVNSHVLIPRPETEVMVEKGLEILEHEPEPIMMDVGTGSGCIALSMAFYLPQAAQIYASDLSLEALKVARSNAQRLGLEHRLTFLHGHALEPFKSKGLHGKVDLLLANPPYIKEEELDALSTEVKDFEPGLALLGGKDGLCHYREIIRGAGEFLRPMGTIVFETSPCLAQEVAKMLSSGERPFAMIETLCDLRGHPRVVLAKRV